MEKYDPDVLFFSETWFKDGLEFNLENYSGVFKNRCSITGGGVCIYVKNSFTLSDVEDSILSSENIEQKYLVK